MGWIQNFVDKFYMTIGKPEKVYPVKVEKHRIQGQNNFDGDLADVNIVKEGMDRGRTLVDDQGNMKFQLQNEPHAEGLVKYEDFNQDLEDTKHATVLMVDRQHFVPMPPQYQFVADTEDIKQMKKCRKRISEINENLKDLEDSEDNPSVNELELKEEKKEHEYKLEKLKKKYFYEGTGVSKIEYVLKTPRMKEMAINQFEEDSKIVETDKKKWWQNPKMQSAILFVGAGLFFVLASFAQGELYYKDVAKQLGQNTEALNALRDSVASQVGGN